jgi:hypothetical protein
LSTTANTLYFVPSMPIMLCLHCKLAGCDRKIKKLNKMQF